MLLKALNTDQVHHHSLRIYVGVNVEILRLTFRQYNIVNISQNLLNSGQTCQYQIKLVKS